MFNEYINKESTVDQNYVVQLIMPTVYVLPAEFVGPDKVDNFSYNMLKFLYGEGQ